MEVVSIISFAPLGLLIHPFLLSTFQICLYSKTKRKAGSLGSLPCLMDFFPVLDKQLLILVFLESLRVKENFYSKYTGFKAGLKFSFPSAFNLNA